MRTFLLTYYVLINTYKISLCIYKCKQAGAQDYNNYITIDQFSYINLMAMALTSHTGIVSATRKWNNSACYSAKHQNEQANKREGRRYLCTCRFQDGRNSVTSHFVSAWSFFCVFLRNPCNRWNKNSQLGKTGICKQSPGYFRISSFLPLHSTSVSDYCFTAVFFSILSFKQHLAVFFLLN